MNMSEYAQRQARKMRMSFEMAIVLCSTLVSLVATTTFYLAWATGSVHVAYIATLITLVTPVTFYKFLKNTFDVD